MAHEFGDYLKQNGIFHQLTVRSSPQQNGVAERKNRIIMELVRCMLKTKKLPSKFWVEAVASAGYVLNRASTKSVKGKTPQEAWSGQKPCVSHLRIFGSICYSHIPAESRGKLDDKSEKCIFIGYSENSKAYKLYNPVTRKTIVSRDVIFNEDEAWDWKDENECTNISFHYNLLEPSDEEIITTPPPSPAATSPPSSSESSSNAPQKTKSISELYDETKRILEEDFVDFALFVDNDPVTFDDAAREEKWRVAMQQEIDAIERNKTWNLIDLPAGKKTIGVKWVYKTKRNASG